MVEAGRLGGLTKMRRVRDGEGEGEGRVARSELSVDAEAAIV